MEVLVPIGVPAAGFVIAMLLVIRGFAIFTRSVNRVDDELEKTRKALEDCRREGMIDRHNLDWTTYRLLWLARRASSVRVPAAFWANPPPPGQPFPDLDRALVEEPPP